MPNGRGSVCAHPWGVNENVCDAAQDKSGEADG